MSETPTISQLNSAATRLVGGQQGAFQAVRESDNADADALVCTCGPALAEGGLEGLGGEQAKGAQGAGAENFTTIHKGGISGFGIVGLPMGNSGGEVLRCL